MALAATGTISALWDRLYAWVHAVLPLVPVCESHENAPSEDGNYICIDYSGTWRLAGTTPSKMVEDRPDLPSPSLYTYRGSVQVRDVDGDGENLMKLVESLHEDNVLEMFGDAGISVLKTTGPVPLPALQQTEWRRESILTLEMAWARAYTGTELTIESVEITQVKFAEGQRNVLQSGENLNIFNITTEAPHGT